MPTRQTLGEFVRIIIEDEVTRMCSSDCADYPACDTKKLYCMAVIVAALDGGQPVERKGK